MPESCDVFISYKREDQAFAETLRVRLIAWGYTAWMDAYNIPAGADWPVEIEKGLAACHTIIAVMTPQAIESENVQNEWEWAIVYRKRLIPLRLQPCKPPLNLIRKNYIDFVPDQEAGFVGLKTALESEEAPVPPDPCQEYLQTLYNRINTVLAWTIIKINPDKPRERKPIPLVSERTRGAVDALFEQQDPVDPMLAAFGIPSQEWKSDDFRTAFEYFGGRVLLLGEPGAGKSITLLHFGRDAVVRRMQDPALPLPIWGLITTWNAEEQTPLAGWLANAYGAPPDVARIVTEGRALLLLDGLDELGSERENPQTHERYDPRQRFMQIIPANNQIVVTCRVQDYEEIGEKIALKGAVTLQQLTDAQIRDYLSAEVPDLWEALKADEELRDVARTPLLLSLFAFAYKDQGNEAAKLRDLRASPGDLRDTIFGEYVRERYEHEERKLKLRKPPEKMPFTLDEIYEVLGFAAMVATGPTHFGIRSIEQQSEILEAFFEHYEETHGQAWEQDFADFAIRLHLLAPKIYTFEFVHLMLQYHFAFIFSLLRLKDPRCYGMIDLLIWAYHWSPAIALGTIGDQRAVEPLVLALTDHDTEIRSDAAEALGMLGCRQAVEPLFDALSDLDNDVREAAAKALGQIGDARAEGPLIQLLSEPPKAFWWHKPINEAAAEALTRIGTPKALAAVEAWRREQNQP